MMSRGGVKWIGRRKNLNYNDVRRTRMLKWVIQDTSTMRGFPGKHGLTISESHNHLLWCVLPSPWAVVVFEALNLRWYPPHFFCPGNTLPGNTLNLQHQVKASTSAVSQVLVLGIHSE